MTREHVVRIGRQTAYDRLAHIILELRNRLDAVGLVRDDSFELPLTQEMLADALGLTPVHVNRTLKKLKKDGQLEISEQLVKLIDRKSLEEKTGFDSGYLERDTLPKEIKESLP